MMMISIMVLIRFDDYPVSGGKRLRMLRANKLMYLCSRKRSSWFTRPRGPRECFRTVLWLEIDWIWMFELGFGCLSGLI